MAGLLPFQIRVNQESLSRGDQAKQCDWTTEQRIKYAVFVDYFKENYRTYCRHGRTNWDFWRRLAMFIQTKNPNQCRIYHKKLMGQFKDVESLLGWFRSSVRQFQNWKAFYQRQLINLCHCLSKEKKSQCEQPTHLNPQKASHKPRKGKKGSITFPGSRESLAESEKYQQQGLQKVKATSFSMSLNTLEYKKQQGTSSSYAAQGENQVWEQKVLSCHKMLLNYLQTLRSLEKDRSSPEE